MVSVPESSRPANVSKRYLEAAKAFLASEDRDRIDKRAKAAWDQTFTGNVELDATLSPQEGEKFLLACQQNLKDEMEKVCRDLSKGDLFFALRSLSPQALGPEIEPLSNDRLLAMAVRRAASHAALLFGKNVPLSADAPYGNLVSQNDKEFGEALSSLLYLASMYITVSDLRGNTAWGYDLKVSQNQSLHSPNMDDEYHHLVDSLNKRKHGYFSPLARVGEFIGGYSSTLNPTGPFLVSTSYDFTQAQTYCYRPVLWELSPILAFLEETEQGPAIRAWGMRGEVFASFLASLCFIADSQLEFDFKSSEDRKITSTLPIEPELIDGDPLLNFARDLLISARYDLSDYDLKQSRQRFINIVCSTNKETTSTRELSIQLADTRYSYLLHNFGHHYIFDYFHSDHWFHRPFSLLASATDGTQGKRKGTRFENRLRTFLDEGSLGKARFNERLRGKLIDQNCLPKGDLECTFKVGSVLFVVEAKAKRLKYQAETLFHKAVQERWKETTQDDLPQAESTAHTLASMRDQPKFKEVLSDVRYLLPLVCIPYPEAILSLDDEYWIIKPDKPRKIVGLPRILTPNELLSFIKDYDEAGIIRVTRNHLIDIEDIALASDT